MATTRLSLPPSTTLVAVEISAESSSHSFNALVSVDSTVGVIVSPSMKPDVPNVASVEPEKMTSPLPFRAAPSETSPSTVAVTLDNPQTSPSGPMTEPLTSTVVLLPRISNRPLTMLPPTENRLSLRTSINCSLSVGVVPSMFKSPLIVSSVGSIAVPAFTSYRTRVESPPTSSSPSPSIVTT